MAPGLDLGRFEASQEASVGDSRITVVRIDPELWELALVGASQTADSASRTAKEWSQEHGLTAAINAGMFGTDYKTHVGYLRARGHVNSYQVNHYPSVAAFDPVADQELAPFRIFDLADPSVILAKILEDYGSAVPNLRPIERPGENRWSRQEKRWSEAALGEDDQGHLLFTVTRSPFSMHELNRELVLVGIGLVGAQRLEGGPEAQFYLHHGDAELELLGSFETSLRESGDNAVP